MRPIRVLELRSVRGTGGGPEKTIFLGAARADRSRFEIVVCYVRDRRDTIYALDKRARTLGVDYVEIFENHSFDYRIWRQLRGVIQSRRIDIVHAHDYKTDVLALALSRVESVIPLATAHAWTGNTIRERFLYYPVDKWVLGRFPKVIAVSSEIRDELVRSGADARRIEVVLNGIDPATHRRGAFDRAAARAEFGFSDDDVVIGSVGRLEQQKRFDLLLEAFSRLRAQDHHLRLIIVGAGSKAEVLSAQAASLGLTGACRFVGHRADIAYLHHALDIFVQSSEYEGTPNAVLEAMAMETPIVATAAGGTAELTRPEHDGIVVPINDLDALVAGIRRVIDDPGEARERARRARARVEQELSFDARTRRLEQIYMQLIQDVRGDS